MTTANKITIARILLIPLFVMMAIYYGGSVARGAPEPWQRWSAITIFVIAAASDGIDGYIARKYNQRSRLGVTLDPIADKGLLLAGIITLSIAKWAYNFPLWFPVLVLRATASSWRVRSCCTSQRHGAGAPELGRQMRDGLPDGGARARHAATGFIHPMSLGSFHFEIHFLDLPVWIAAIFTAISGVGYIVDGIAQLHVHGQADSEAAQNVKTPK